MADLPTLLTQRPILEAILPHLTLSDIATLSSTNSNIAASLSGCVNPQTKLHSIRRHLVRCEEVIDDQSNLCQNVTGVEYCHASNNVPEPGLHDMMGRVRPPHVLCHTCQQRTHLSCNAGNREVRVLEQILVAPLCNDCCIEEELANTVRLKHRCVTSISGPGEFYLCQSDRKHLYHMMIERSTTKDLDISKRGRNDAGEWEEVDPRENVCICGKPCDPGELNINTSPMLICLLCDVVVWRGLHRYDPFLRNTQMTLLPFMHPDVPHSERVRARILHEWGRLGPRRNRVVLKLTPPLVDGEVRGKRGRKRKWSSASLG